MPALRRIIEHLTVESDGDASWIELVRDLGEPITVQVPAITFSRRWADEGDIAEIAALEGFVKTIEVMANAFRHGDRCLLLDRGGRIGAFAWIAFRDYPLALWHTLRLPPKAAYLVYIFVRPEFRRRGVAAYLLGSVMGHLRTMGYERLISGMYDDWQASIDLHRKAGFRIQKKFIVRKLLRVIPVPPKEVEFDG